MEGGDAHARVARQCGDVIVAGIGSVSERGPERALTKFFAGAHNFEVNITTLASSSKPRLDKELQIYRPQVPAKVPATL